MNYLYYVIGFFERCRNCIFLINYILYKCLLIILINYIFFFIDVFFVFDSNSVEVEFVI